MSTLIMLAIVIGQTAFLTTLILYRTRARKLRAVYDRDQRRNRLVPEGGLRVVHSTGKGN